MLCSDGNFWPDDLVARHIATVEKWEKKHQQGWRVFAQPDGSP